jgi:hypothetical protein
MDLDQLTLGQRAVVDLWVVFDSQIRGFVAIEHGVIWGAGETVEDAVAAAREEADEVDNYLALYCERDWGPWQRDEPVFDIVSATLRLVVACQMESREEIIRLGWVIRDDGVADLAAAVQPDYVRGQVAEMVAIDAERKRIHWPLFYECFDPDDDAEC